MARAGPAGRWLVGLALITTACATPAAAPRSPERTASLAPEPTAVPTPDASPPPLAVEVGGLVIVCGTLPEADCRSVVAALAADAVGATRADVGACDGVVCPAIPPGALGVSVILRWGEGDLTKVESCIRSGPGAAFRCTRAPVDLGSRVRGRPA